MTLAVCTVVENPLQWKAREKNYKVFAKHVRDSGAQLYTIEIAYANRPHIIPNVYPDYVFHVRTDCEIWHKENALNLLLQRVTEDKVAWIDADITFARPDWVEETLRLLDHYPILQMFSHTINLGSDYHPRPDAHDGYVYEWLKHGRKTPTKEIRTGIAWAARKESLSKIGMLIDWAIVGGGDHHMAAGFIGDMNASLGAKFSDNYVDKCKQWSYAVDKHINKQVGYVPGLALHHWHGDHKRREYKTKPNIMADNNYQPDNDLRKDWQGLNYLVGEREKLRDDIRDFLRRRDDDSLEDTRLIP